MDFILFARAEAFPVYYAYQVPENAQDHESQDDNHAGDHARDDGFTHAAVGVIVVARLRHDVCHLDLRRDIDSFSDGCKPIFLHFLHLYPSCHSHLMGHNAVAVGHFQDESPAGGKD